MICLAVSSCEFPPVEQGLCRTHLRAVARSRLLVLVPRSSTVAPLTAEQVRLVDSVRHFIQCEAGRYIKVVPNPVALEWEDLVSEGIAGAIIAVRRFDASRGLKFLTFASHWIKHHMHRALQDQGRTVRVPVHVQDRKRDKSGEDAKSVNERLRLSRYGTISIDAPLATDSETTIADRVTDDALTIEESLTNEATIVALHEAIKNLKPKLRNIIRQRMKGRTLGEIGAVFGVSRERVRQLETQAMAEMREFLVSSENR